MSITTADLRRVIEWHREYRAEWDAAPDQYEQHGIVGWGKSRRLGIYRQGIIKAYIGLQHVDTSKLGWNIADESHTRFFISLFVSGRVVTLRTFPTLDAVLDFLLSAVKQYS